MAKRRKVPRKKPHAEIADDDPRCIAWLEARSILGNTESAAKAIGISRAGVSQWKICPTERCLLIEKLTGVSRYRLRPDIYGDEPAEAAA